MQKFQCYRVLACFYRVCMLIAVWLMAPTLWAQDEPGYLSGDPDICLGCHRAGGPVPADGILDSIHRIVVRSESTVAAEGAQGRHCQACHGPSSNHMRLNADGTRPPPPVVFNASTAMEDKNNACLGCHQDEVGQAWNGSTHHFEQLACSDCHQLHIARDPILADSGQMPVCLSCHRQQRSELQRPSAHPVERGLLSCSDCHQPHGGSGEKMLVKNSINETCYLCHAEKRGPVLWEHAPVREDCSNCHVPHGSNHASLLVSRPPFLCQQCHLAQFHPSTVFGGDDLPPNGASRYLVNRNCMNCHTQIHGSNHPSGTGLTR